MTLAGMILENIAMNNLQHQRLELKYLVHESVALAVRCFIGAYLTLDEFGAAEPDFSYPVHSLYLDSDILAFYWETINGSKNRYKLRLRYYDDKPESPVFFEIKRRMNDVILKERGAVRREAASALLAGQLPDREQLFFADDPDQLPALERFCRLMQHHAAKPKAHVAYRREAWISPHGHPARVTMDRQIQFAYEPAPTLSVEMRNPKRVFENAVVLELKFTGRFPDWFRELVRCFNLWQCPAAKYADGITLLAESNLDFETFAVSPAPEMEEKFQSRLQFLKKNQQTTEPAFA
jgi:SPX domain protein involved in polyphosphate accumulation